MSLFGNYGKTGAKNSLFPSDKPVTNSLFPSDKPVAVSPKLQAAPDLISAPPALEPLGVATGGPCDHFRLDMSASFGMCHCGFDRKAHEEKEKVLDAPEKRKSIAVGVPKSAAVSVSPTPPKTGLFAFAKASEAKPAQVTIESKPSEAKPTQVTIERKPPEFINLGTGNGDTSTSVFRLQALLQGAGFSPLPSDAGTAASDSIADLPEFLRSALLTIMQADSKATQSTPVVIVHRVESRQRVGSDVSNRSRVSSFADYTGPATTLSPPAPKRSLFQPAAMPPAAQPKPTSVPQQAKTLFISPAPPVCQSVAPSAIEPQASSASTLFKPQSTPRSAVSVTIPVAQSSAVCPPCSNFQVDLASSQFGMCKCGFDRASHSSLGVVNQTVVSRGRKTSISSQSSAVIRYASAPPPPTHENTVDIVVDGQLSTPAGRACSSFQIDTAAQFGMCRCGFDRGAHENNQATAPSATTRPKPAVRSATTHFFSSTPSQSTRPNGGAVVRSASARFANAPAPVVFTNTSNSQSGVNAVPCGEFQLDMASAQFGMCKCGFDRHAHARKDVKDGASESFRIYTLDQLKSRKATGNFSGLDPMRLECFLEEREFLKTFGMDPEQFKKLPGWKQKENKKAAGIF